MIVKLSENFSLPEMIKSRTASSFDIDNTPGKEEIENLTRLVKTVLQPLRDNIGPVIVSSGFRCEEVNKRIGGSQNPLSAHVFGRAADIESISLSTPQLAEKLFELSLPFDKCILEYWDLGSEKSDGWIHLQVTKRQEVRPRRLLYHKTKTKNYTPLSFDELISFCKE